MAYNQPLLKEIQMFNFDAYLNLPLIWGGLLAVGIFLYVLLDGADLGVGILFPFAPSDECRSRMMNSIAPFWDGNETWLILGGGGLFAAFPLAYSILMPAFYMPVFFMLIGLILRGVAFEFRSKTQTPQGRALWNYAFHFGSLSAAFFQGTMLGAFVQGVQVENQVFVGGNFDWATSFSFLTGIAMIFGYGLLGATWVILKTEDQTQEWARQSALYLLFYTTIFMSVVSFWAPFLHPQIFERWFSWPNLMLLSPIPLLTAFTLFLLFRSLIRKQEAMPFLLSIGLFSLGYIGLAISLWPWVIPYQLSLAEAAAEPHSQSLLLVGVVLLLPFILGYTAYCYYIFRGKTTHHPLY